MCEYIPTTGLFVLWRADPTWSWRQQPVFRLLKHDIIPSPSSGALLLWLGSPSSCPPSHQEERGKGKAKGQGEDISTFFSLRLPWVFHPPSPSQIRQNDKLVLQEGQHR